MTPLGIILCSQLCSHMAFKNIYLLFMAILFPVIGTNKTFLIFSSLISGYLEHVMLLLPDLVENPDNDIPLDGISVGFYLCFMLSFGLFPGPLIKDYLHLVALSFLWHFTLLHFREYWMMNFFMYKSKYTSPPPPRPGNH